MATINPPEDWQCLCTQGGQVYELPPSLSCPRQREQLQMIVMEFLTLDDRLYFGAAAREELQASFTRCGCGRYALVNQGWLLCTHELVNDFME